MSVRISSRWMLLIVVSALGAAGIVGGLSNPASAAIPKPESISTSYYIAGAAGAKLNDVLYDDGESQGNADCNGGNIQYSYEFLDFGAQLLPGSSEGETESVDDQHYYTDSQIEKMVLSFAEGYAVEDLACIVASKGDDPGSYTELAIGTNNAGQTPTKAQAKKQADSWWNVTATAANDYYSYASGNQELSSAGIQYDVLMGASSDMELGTGYNPASATIPWAKEQFTDATSLSGPPTEDTTIGYDYGSADGCYNSNGPLTGSFECSPGWTVADVSTVIIDTFPTPQIYLAPPNGEQPEEWTQLCVYSDTKGEQPGVSPLKDQAILSEPTGGSGYLSTSASWDDIISALQGSGNDDCATELPVLETNADMEATPGGNVTWP